METNVRKLSRLVKSPSLVIASVSVLAISGQLGMAQVPKVIAAQNVQEEYVMYGNVNLSGGETSVAVDPTDPNHIIVGVLTTKNRPLPSGELPDGTPEQESRRSKEAHAYCVFAQTWDGGKTWTYFEDHTGLNNYDSALQFAPDGTLYKYVEAVGDFKTSVDKGKTWSAGGGATPSTTMALRAVVRIYVDNLTGTVYAAGTSRGTPDNPARPSFVVSHDKGATWTPPQSWDSMSKDYPSLGGYSASAGNGSLAVAYISGTAGGATPRIVFGTSKDEGKTFERHVVTPYTGTLSNRVILAADQSKPGRYAILTMSPDATQLWTYVTENSGNTWSKAVAAQAPKGTMLLNKESKNPAAILKKDNLRLLWAMRYNRKGQLAILWRARYPDDSYDVWSSFSNDGGKTFKSLRVSNTTSPVKSLERGAFLEHEDYWDLDLDNESVHFVYTGSQPGFLATWYARIPIADYLK